MSFKEREATTWRTLSEVLRKLFLRMWCG